MGNAKGIAGLAIVMALLGGACSSGGGDDESGAVRIYVGSQYFVTATQLETALEAETDYEIEIVKSDWSELRQAVDDGVGMDAVIEVQSRLEELAELSNVDAVPVNLGSDIIQAVTGSERDDVPQGADLVAGMAAAELRVGACPVGSPCAALVDDLLIQLDVAPEFSTRGPGHDLVDLAIADELDVGLMLRSDARSRLAKSRVLILPQDVIAEELVQILPTGENEDLDGVIEWFTSAPEAQTVFVTRGLAAFDTSTEEP